MDEGIRRALNADLVVDITTTGRRTGAARRIEMWFHNVEGRIYLTGTPGRRDWFANLLARPDFTFHLKESLTADLPAVARVVTDEVERRAVLGEITGRIGQTHRLDRWVDHSPLVEVRLG